MTRLGRRRFLGGLIASVVAAGVPLPAGAEAVLGDVLDPIFQEYFTDPYMWFMEADGPWANIMDWKFVYGTASGMSDAP